mmetsp:Transcript_7154/g.17480  ORF Transcript_7154/g.17480 Transcript_7154/m.17480 type:complete len:90 (+) Transcript_7154:370-639(+)
MTPLQSLDGSTPDVSSIMQFSFYERVYYAYDNTRSFPEAENERLGHLVGISENVGHAISYLILTDDTNKILSRSGIEIPSMSVPLCGQD